MVRIWDACGLVADVEPAAVGAAWLHNKVPGITMCSAYKPGWLASKTFILNALTGEVVTDFKRVKDVILVLKDTTSLPFDEISRRVSTVPPPEPVCALVHKGQPQVPLAIPHPHAIRIPPVTPQASVLDDVLAYTAYWRILYGALQLVSPDLSFLYAPLKETPLLLAESRRVYHTLVYYQLSPTGNFAILPPKSHIPDRWFCNAGWHAVMGDRTIRSIGDEAFMNTRNLYALRLRDVTHIGRTAFWMSGIHRIDLRGSTLRTLPEATFLGCSNLAIVHLNDTLARIGASAFMNTGLTELFIPPSVTHIGQSVCKDTPIKHVTLFCNVPAHAFYRCDHLQTVKFSGSIIGHDAFYGTKSLRNVDVSNVRLINSGAFSHSGLKGTLVLNGVVCSHAFLHNRFLTVVVVGPRGALLPRAFASCERLATVLTHPSLETSFNAPDARGWIWEESSPFKHCNYMLRWENGLRLNVKIGTTTPYVNNLKWEEWGSHRSKSVRSYFDLVRGYVARSMRLSVDSLPVTHILSFLRDSDVPQDDVVLSVSIANLQISQKLNLRNSAAQASALLSYARRPVAEVRDRAVYVNLEGVVAYPALLTPWLSGEIFFPVTVWQSCVSNGITTLVVTPQKPPPFNNYYRVADRVITAFKKAILNGCRLYKQPCVNATPTV